MITIVCCNKDDNNPIEPVLETPANFNQTEPANGVTLQSWNPEFSWEAATGATTYSLIISANSDFTSPIVDEADLTDTNYTPTKAFLGGTAYFWKVIAYNEHGSTIATNAGISFSTPNEPAPGKTYHVSTTGVDSPGNGTIESPFHTLAYACTQAVANEDRYIYLHTGSYTETEPALVPLGVNIIGDGEDNTILLSSGVTGDPANIDNNEKPDGSLIQLVSPIFSGKLLPAENGNQILSGFSVNGNGKLLKAAVWVVNRSNVTMHHVTIKNCKWRGAVFTAGGKNVYAHDDQWMNNTKVYNCTFINSGKDFPSTTSDPKNGFTLGNLCLGGLDGADIYNITINDNEGYGIKFIHNGFYKNVKIHDSNITVSESDVAWGEDAAIELWNMGPGNELYNVNCNTWFSLVNFENKYATPNGTENLKVHNVKIIDSDNKSSKEAIEVAAPGVEIFDSYFQDKGFGMAVWNKGKVNITIRNNVFFSTTVKGGFGGGAAVYIDNSETFGFSNINIFNNVFDKNGTGVIIKTVGSAASTTISDINISNNAFLNVSGNDIVVSGVGISNITADNNLKYNAATKAWSISEIVTQSNNISGDPQYQNTGDRWDTYYKPSSASSFAVDKGIDVSLPFNSTAPDIGAFEF